MSDEPSDVIDLARGRKLKSKKYYKHAQTLLNYYTIDTENKNFQILVKTKW